MNSKLLKKGTAISGSRWIAYATASAASFFSASQFAQAAIHYSGVIDVRLPKNTDETVTFQIDRPGDSIFFKHRAPTEFNSFAGVAVAGIQTGGLRFVPSIDNFYAVNLQRGRYVSPGNFVTFKSEKHYFATLARSRSGGYFGKGVGYVGFKFNNGAGTQYGWARLRMADEHGKDSFIVHDFAYADPGESIRAGQTSESDVAEPALGSLGLLAAGAAGLALWRKRR